MKNRIVRFAKIGGPDVLELFDEKIESPKEDEIRFRVKALGLNQAEVMLREGRYVGSPQFPSRIGVEGSGIIEEVGKNVSNWKAGDEVCAIPFLSWNDSLCAFFVSSRINFC